MDGTKNDVHLHFKAREEQNNGVLILSFQVTMTKKEEEIQSDEFQKE